MVVTLRWRVVRWRLCNPTTMFCSCLGRRVERTLRLAWVSTMVTSTSATTGEWFSTAGSPALSSAADFAQQGEFDEYCGKEKKSAKEEGEELDRCLTLL